MNKLSLKCVRAGRPTSLGRPFNFGTTLLALAGLSTSLLATAALCSGEAREPDTTSAPAAPVTDPLYDDAQAMAEAEACGCLLPPSAWELWAIDNHCDQDTLSLIIQVAAENPREDICVGALLVSIPGGGENRQFDINATGDAGTSFGLMQLRLGGDCYHRRAEMKRLGLDWRNEADRLTYCLRHMIFPALDAGHSLRTALRPWAARSGALRLYSELSGEGNE